MEKSGTRKKENQYNRGKGGEPYREGKIGEHEETMLNHRTICLTIRALMYYVEEYVRELKKENGLQYVLTSVDLDQLTAGNGYLCNSFQTT